VADEEAFLGEPLQRLADRAAGRPQLAGQDGFVDLLSGPKGSLDDLFPQLVRDQLRSWSAFDDEEALRCRHCYQLNFPCSGQDAWKLALPNRRQFTDPR
jgi:hypothetical protein